MASAELIGRMFAGVMKFDSVRGGSAGDSLSKAELAGMLAKLSPSEMNMALAKYGCDDNARQALVGNVGAWVITVAMRDNWRPRCRDVLMGMATLAVYEVVGGLLCAKCDGTGMASMIRTCKCCDGTGHKAMSGRAKAEAIGVDERQWRTIWKVRYETIFDYVNGLDSTVHKHLRFAEFERMEQDYF